jgi:hypothetical protein
MRWTGFEPGFGIGTGKDLDSRILRATFISSDDLPEKTEEKRGRLRDRTSWCGA